MEAKLRAPGAPVVWRTPYPRTRSWAYSGPMSRLVRMDHTGHTTVAEWEATDPEAVERAVSAFRAELDRGYFAMVSTGEGHAEMVKELPVDAPLVVLRLPIAGG